MSKWNGHLDRKPARFQKNNSLPPERLDFHLELLAFFQRLHERRHQLRDQLQIFQAHDFDGRVHIAIRQTDERTGDAAARPKNHVRVRAARGRHRLMLERNLLLRRDGFQPLHHFGMIATAVRERGAFANFNIAVLRLADGRIIRRVRHIHDERDVRLERIRDLPRAQQADFFLHVRDGADFTIQFHLGFFEQPQRLGHGERADAIVKRARHREIAAQNIKFIRQRNWVADPDNFLRVFAAADADINENVVNLWRFRFAVRLHQMRRDITDDTFDRAVTRVDDDALRLGDGRVNAAHTPDIDEAVVINIIHRHRDFVRVRREHDARSAALVQHGDAVAVGIGKSFIGELAGVIQPDALTARFVAGGAGRVDEGFKKIN